MTHTLLAETFYRPPLGLTVVVLAIAAVVVLLLMSARRERAWWTMPLRLGALAGVAWLLMGPSVTKPGQPPNDRLPLLSILVDTSASMAQDDVLDADGQPITRLQAIQDNWLSNDRLDQLKEHAELEIYAFDEQVRAAYRQNLAAAGPSTRLYDALARTRANATLILSDGHDTTPARTRPDSPDAGRLFASPIGTPRSSPDLSIDAWPDSDRLFEGQSTTISASIHQRGFEGKRAIVELLEQGEVVEQRPITLNASSATLRFEIKPTLPIGVTVQASQYTARIRLAEGEEAYTKNNRTDLFVQVSRGKIRVLLLEGEPYWDTRSLGRLIGAHPRFDLTGVYGFGDRRKSRLLGESYEAGSDPAAQLERFDIVVLGRRVDRLVDADFGKRLDAFVRNGGSAVFARGQAFDDATASGKRLNQDVQALSPGRWGRSVIGQMRVRLNESGDAPGSLSELSDQAVISRLPGMLAATQIDARKAASLVLLEQQPNAQGPAMAALTTMRIGSGISMAVLTEGLWRWELLPGVDGDEQAESAYDVFWIRAMQWLASGGEFLPGQDIALEADRLSLEPSETTTLTVSTRYIEQQGLNLQLVAIGADGQAQPLTLTPGTLGNRYNATYTPGSAGITRFELRSPGRDDLIDPARPLTTSVAVIERSQERRDTSAQPDRLKQITEPTGGKCLRLDETGPLIDYLQTLQMARGTQDTTAYDFNRFPAFALILGCLGLEWILRRRSGLR